MFLLTVATQPEIQPASLNELRIKKNHWKMVSDAELVWALNEAVAAYFKARFIYYNGKSPYSSVLIAIINAVRIYFFILFLANLQSTLQIEQ
jgi:hypothetical protein